MVSIFSLIFLFMPTISSSYWILLDLLGLGYLIMYILMFLAAIRLRYIKPDIHRAYKIIGGNVGMWIIAGIGLSTSLFTIFIGFFPPAQLPVGSIIFYDTFLVLGLTIMLIIPIFIHHVKKLSWISAR
jgi:amino acid transporter